MEKDGDSLNEHQENIGKTNDILYFLLKLSILFYPMSNCRVHFGSNTNIFGVYLKFSHTIEYKSSLTKISLSKTEATYLVEVNGIIFF